MSRVYKVFTLQRPVYNENATTISLLTNERIPILQYYEELNILNKASILQYSKNSNNLTKKQKYVLLTKTNSNKGGITWATQSTNGIEPTNPNTQNLLRINSININLNKNQSNLPITCPNSKQLLNNNINNNNNIIIQDMGTLIYNIKENICTGNINVINTNNYKLCSLTSSLNIPGPEKVICWNKNLSVFKNNRYI
jgi:hypothetical protein